MGFTIPNDVAGGTAKQHAQAAPDSVDIDILIAGHNLTGVQSGCAVSAQGSPNMTVAVASGTVGVAGVAAAVAAGNVTITTADASHPRFDLVVVNSSGTKSVTAGTPAAAPVFPAMPASSAVLAAVYVGAGVTSIATADIVDKRVILNSTTYGLLQDAEPYNAPLWDGIYNGVTYRNSLISLSFDDGPTSDFTVVFPLLTARYLPATFALNSSKMGDGTHLSAANALSMQQAGMEIACHSKTHGADPANFAAFLDEAITDRDTLQGLTGIFCQSFVQPGTWTATYNMDSAADMETQWGRTLRRYFAAVFAYVPEAQFDGNYKLAGGRKYGALHYSPGSSLAAAEAAVDAVINAGGLLDILVHSASLDTGGNLTTANFTTLLTYIQTKRDAGLVDVVTRSGGVYAKQSNPRVNIAPNPTFDVNNGFSPWGASGSPLVVVGAGHTPGHNALQVNATNYVSRAWRATEMRSVLAEVWVKNAVVGANSTAIFQIYSRDPDLSTIYGLRSSGVVATTDTYQKLQLIGGIDSRAQDFVCKMTSNNAAGANDVLFSEVAIYKAG